MVRLSKAVRPLPQTAPVWHVCAKKMLAVTALALTTANCAGPQPQKMAVSGGSGVDSKYGVKASPRLYNEGDVIPKGGGRRFSGKPYVVAGRTYVPREDAKGYVREGLASWYGSAFHGRLTANGEVFDRNSVAAAHPTMPLPSYARVTNLANGHSMVVRVNDRGPYHANRLMDVSEEVAQALDFRRSGTARVRVEYVGKASTAGSDDAKLMATLRTDGQPASVRGSSPVMMADLGPDASETLAKPRRTAMAFKSAAEQDEPAPRPVRVAPSVVAAAPIVAIPHAVQPTTTRTASFVPTRPSPASRTTHVVEAPAPLSLAPPPIRLAGARHEVAPAHRAAVPTMRMAASPLPFSATRAAFAPTPDKRPAVSPSRVAGVALPGSSAAKPIAGRSVTPVKVMAPLKPVLLAGAKPSGSNGRGVPVAKPALAELMSRVSKPATAPAVKSSRRAQFARVE